MSGITTPNTRDVTDEQTLVSLIYLSTATRPFGKDELMELLAKSRRNNAQRGVTGMLLYKDGSFAQVLEGPADVVDALYDKISRDMRHRGITTILRRTITERQFPDWSMGFCNVGETSPNDMDGFTDFLEPVSKELRRLTSRPNHAMTMLLAFRDSVR